MITTTRRIRVITPQQLDNLENYLKQGISVQKIADEWEVSGRIIYRWINILGINIKKVKVKQKVTKQKNYSYFSYINTSFKKGQMSKKERDKALNTFYSNRKKIFIEEIRLQDVKQNYEQY